MRVQRPLGLLPPGNRHMHGRKPGRVSPGPSRRRRPLTWRVPPLRAACTTLRGSCVSSVPPGSSATPRWEPRRTASPAPALTPTRTTSELCPLTGPGFNPPPRPPPCQPSSCLAGSPRPARALGTAATSARRASPATRASTANGAFDFLTSVADAALMVPSFSPLPLPPSAVLPGTSGTPRTE